MCLHRYQLPICDVLVFFYYPILTELIDAPRPPPPGPENNSPIDIKMVSFFGLHVMNLS